MILFVVRQQDQVVDDAMHQRINARIRTKTSAHHILDEVMQVADIRRNLSGKRWQSEVLARFAGEMPPAASRQLFLLFGHRNRFPNVGYCPTSRPLFQGRGDFASSRWGFMEFSFKERNPIVAR
jgi:hypothetical protein